MKAHDRRTRSRRDFRLEPLEERSLLNGAPPAPAPLVTGHTGWFHGSDSIHHRPVIVHTQAQATPHEVTRTHLAAVVSGKINGRIIQPPTLPGVDTLATVFGVGVAHRFGTVTYLSQFLVHREDLFSGVQTIQAGSGSISSARLGQINVGYSGAEQGPDPFHGTFNLTGAVTTITGGPYAGLTGTFNALGSLDPQTGRFVMNYKICLFRTVTHTVA